MDTGLQEAILSKGKSYPKNFVQKRDLFVLDIVIAERKAFLSRQTLTYRAVLRVDDRKKEFRFFEILKESGAGVSTGGGDEMSSGFGFKVEKTRVGVGGARTGTIEEQSNLFGQKYQYNFDFKNIRSEMEEIAKTFGYSFLLVLSERSL